MAINEQQKQEETPQEILNKSVDPRFGVLVTEMLGYDPDNVSLRNIVVDERGRLETSVDKYAVRVSVDSVHNDWFYIGKAEPSAENSDEAWQIKKMVKTTTDITITWADGDLSFDNVWDDRESLTYS